METIKNRALKFGYKVVDKTPNYVCKPIKRNQTESDNVIALIYAPDPLTGLPDPALPLKLMNSNESSIRRVLDNFVFRPLPHKDSNMDADGALDTTAPRSAQFGVDRDKYIEALNDAVRSGIEELNEINSQSDLSNESEGE